MKGFVLGLTGHARAGKNTVASIIAQEKAADWLIRSEGFADRLKVSAARALGFIGPDAEQIARMDELKVRGGVTAHLPGFHRPISGRQFLQNYGTEAHRDVFGADFWVDAVVPPPNARLWQDPPFDLLVVTDVRFENEARRIREVGGIIWRIERTQGVVTTGHASEAPLDSTLVDRVIVNDGSLDALRRQVVAAFPALSDPSRGFEWPDVLDLEQRS